MCAIAGWLILASCDQSAIDPSESLVGATSFPTEVELARETIQINRGTADAYSNPAGDHFLSYELRPDNSLTVIHSMQYIQSDEVRGKETFRLSSETANKARRLLWRIRPAPLPGIEYLTRPTGCQRRGPHDFGEITVAFFREEDRAGTGDHEIGIFDLPRPQSCNNRPAIEARDLVRRVLESFPPSQVAAGYPLAVARRSSYR